MDDPRSLKCLSNQPARRQAWLTRALDWLIPPECVLCRRPGWPSRLCDGCHDELPWQRAGCRICAAELPEAGVCGACLRRPPAFDATVAVFRYAHPVDRLIQALKYRHDIAVAGALAQRMAEQSQALCFDRIIPVPLHRRRLAERGFNQSVMLAKGVVREHGIPLDLSSVVRARETPPQAGLGLKERRRNLRRAFDVRRRLDGASILVVDDVMTSGATLDRLAEALKAAGADRVTNLVCARTPDGR